MNEWRLTGFYGEPDRAKRRNTWDLLRNLARDANLPWCLLGDLNIVGSADDKRGGELYPEWLVDGFNETIHEASLVDLELLGHQFTWKRGRGTDDWMEIKLDRALTNETWFNIYPRAKLYNLEGASSDHSVILLVPQTLNRRAWVYRFKFENAWLTKPMCEQLVRDGWTDDLGHNIQEKIKWCSDKLAIWEKEITGNFAGRIKDCKAELRHYKNGMDTVSKENYNKAKTKLENIFNQREILWRQRSKQLWLQAGDKNSKYFHKIASRRRRNNHILKLQEEDGKWLDWDHGLPGLIMDYFNNLFTATETEWQEVIEWVPSTITNIQNDELLRPVVEEEVKAALFQMNQDKAPGPDGMTPTFF